ncbi:MAG: hypothetical protein IK010_00040 [Bacteroidales bacterium]|nr:hypothetical protein [Bacteroidales bacterium]
MKATKFLMMFVAAAAMIFTACGEEDNTDDNGGGNNNTQTEAAANTFVYNGTVYAINSYYSIAQDGRGYVDAFAVDTLPDGTPIFNIVSDVSATGSFDLTQGGEYFFRVSSEVEYIVSFDQSSHDGELNGSIGEAEYEGSGAFSEGTLTTTKDEDAAVLKVSGTLKDGTSVSFHLYMPASEWEYLEW